MLNIKQITIEGFRGIRKNLTLIPEGKSLLLFAENSRGKSSITDGLEWFFDDQNLINHLRSEGTTARDYQHLLAGDAGEESKVTVEFTKGKPLTKTLKTKPKIEVTCSDDAAFLDAYEKLIVPPCLRHLDVARFVLEAKGEKYKILAKWMGFEYLLEEQLLLWDTKEEIRIHIKGLTDAQAAAKDELKSTINNPASEKNTLIYCNQILKNMGEAPVQTMKEVGEKIKIIEEKQLTQKALKESQMALVQEQLEKFSSKKFGILIKKITDEGIKNNSDSVETKKLKIESLYSIGLSLLTDTTSSAEACPLCNTTWPMTVLGDKESLIEHVRTELKSLEDIKRRRTEFTQKTGELIKELEDAERVDLLSLSSNVGQAWNLLEKCDITLKRKADFHKKNLQEVQKALEKQNWEEAEAIKADESGAELDVEIAKLATNLSNERSKVALTPEEKRLSSSITNLAQAYRLWVNLDKASEKVNFFEAEQKKVIDVCKKIEDVLQQSVQKSFEVVSTLMESYFKILRPPSEESNNVENIKLELSEKGRASGRAVEVEFTFHKRSEKISPPKRVMTESHLNALGISLYLALAKTLNINAKFLILDDVINSLDMAHRTNFVKLLDQEFSDFQLFLFTHDEICFETLTRIIKDKVKKRLVRWTFADGPELVPALTYLEKAKEATKNDEPRDAGKALGDYIERTLNILCEKLAANTRHTYAERARHTIGELFNAVEAQCKSLKAPQSLKDKLANGQLASILRNISSHDLEPLPSSYSTPEIKSFIIEWESIEKEFYCNNCQEFVEKIMGKDLAICKKGCLHVP